jgi:hypothetical protein
VLLIEHMQAARRDTWWCVPCLRIEARGRAYRYGWPRLRRDPASEFELDEWLGRLRSAAGLDQ